MKMLPVEFSAGNYSIILFFHLAVAIIFLLGYLIIARSYLDTIDNQLLVKNLFVF